MKKAALLFLAVLLASCATIQQNIDARALLAQCRYEYSGIRVAGVQFGSGVVVDAVDLEVKVKVTNTVTRDVALDHAELSFFLDKHGVLDTAHKQFVRIAPKDSSVETVNVSLPFSSMVKTLGHRPETLGVKAKLWVTLLVGKDTWETPLVIPVEVEVPVPYDQIDAFVAQKKKQLEEQAAAKARDAAAQAAEAAKNALPAAPTLKF